jgi:NADP-dependent 3-hydroxy acid dehydrogenase YdfG
MEIESAVCIVTGSSSGIGATTARMLSEAGARVVLATRRTERLDVLAHELSDSLAVTTDMTLPEDVHRLVARTIETYGTVDVLINNAGQGLHVPLDELDPVDLRAVFELNVVAPLVGILSVLPHMRAGSGGAIVNVSSATSLRVFPGLGGYSATKAALNLLSQVGRIEFAPARVAVSIVHPSVTVTEFHQRLRAGHLVSSGRSIPPDPPELVAQAIAMAVSTGEPHVLVADPPKPSSPGTARAGVPSSPAKLPMRPVRQSSSTQRPEPAPKRPTAVIPDDPGDRSERTDRAQHGGRPGSRRPRGPCLRHFPRRRAARRRARRNRGPRGRLLDPDHVRRAVERVGTCAGGGTSRW